MRTLLLAGVAALSLAALPTGLSAQQSADAANAANPPAPATTTVTNNPGNLTAPPQAALNQSYPVCTRALQDNCQNPGEGGAPGTSRALGYWPGEPASERRERGG